MRTTILTLALLALAGCVRDQPDTDTGRTPATTQEKPAAPQKTPEQEFGEKWLFGDILDHLNAKLPERQKFKKIPSRSHPSTMYFVYDTPENGDLKSDTLDAWFQYGGLPNAMLRIQARGSADAARKEVVLLRDQRNVANVFSWGKYVFRGTKETLDWARPLLP